MHQPTKEIKKMWNRTEKKTEKHKTYVVFLRDSNKIPTIITNYSKFLKLSLSVRSVLNATMHHFNIHTHACMHASITHWIPVI